MILKSGGFRLPCATASLVFCTGGDEAAELRIEYPGHKLLPRVMMPIANSAILASPAL